jgi:hypothetical protein
MEPKWPGLGHPTISVTGKSAETRSRSSASISADYNRLRIH